VERRPRHWLGNGTWLHDVEALAVAKGRPLESIPRTTSFDQVRGELDEHRRPLVHRPRRTLKDMALRSLRLQPDQRRRWIEGGNDVVVPCRRKLDRLTRSLALKASRSIAVETMVSGVVRRQLKDHGRVRLGAKRNLMRDDAILHSVENDVGPKQPVVAGNRLDGDGSLGQAAIHRGDADDADVGPHLHQRFELESRTKCGENSRESVEEAIAFAPQDSPDDSIARLKNERLGAAGDGTEVGSLGDEIELRRPERQGSTARNESK